MKSTFASLALAAGLLTPAVASAQADGEYTFGWSNYIGWCPVKYLADTGLLEKHAKKNGISIHVEEFGYVASIDAFKAKSIDVVPVTTMDALTLISQAGIDTSFFVVGDYSNGNDMWLAKGARSVADLKGTTVYGEEFTVSHYLVYRGIVLGGQKESDYKFAHRAEKGIVSGFTTDDAAKKSTATWNPHALGLLQQPGVVSVFDSSKIPGEILDGFVMRSDLLKADPKLATAISGAWFEAMATLSGGGQDAEDLIATIAQAANVTVAEAKAQLKTTHFYTTPESMTAELKSKAHQQATTLVRDFCFDQGLLGEDAEEAGYLGIQFADGKVLGDSGNVKLRFQPVAAE
ncbi:NitT/TauT family transport system substrate-binding protein [Haloferula luteola]|uniref:NitT/TauT family transport system substrate-binding protein n=1 Tax=Haloferula luteola TaxID=595692 RepID=A0A840V5G5_9BACT|nr:lipid kinase [Haloferula luteola]MBB5353212.1 NitT/TauT family transport system substrate-binding protein [Haloferula luteola]